MRCLPLVLIIAFVPGCRLFGPDKRDAPDLRVEATAARVARGDYLVNHVTACMGCHTEGDKSKFSLPPLKTLGTGGDCFMEPHFPGTICGSNITNHADGIKDWTDGELIRAIREGVNREGDTIFPMMPYVHYRSMSDEDAMAVIAYIRTATPAAGKVKPTDINFPVSMFVNFAPQPIEGVVPEPDRNDSVAYGKYLSTIAGCKQCHTPVDDNKQLLEDRLFAGGQVFKDDKTANVVSANITPHATGLNRFTREQFIARFKAFESPESLAKVTPQEQTVMPWWVYGGMAAEDLGAIYDFLKTVPAIDHAVVHFPDNK